jgi:hypothetical protein
VDDRRQCEVDEVDIRIGQHGVVVAGHGDGQTRRERRRTLGIARADRAHLDAVDRVGRLHHGALGDAARAEDADAHRRTHPSPL